MTTYVAIPQAVVDALRYTIMQMSEEDTDYQSISTASSILAVVRFLLVKNNILRCRHSIRVDDNWHAHCKGCGALFKRNCRDDVWHERDIPVYGRLFEMLGLMSMNDLENEGRREEEDHDSDEYIH
ncbi:MAG: hypothetical protein QW560_02580 [Candidatus Nitrosocaldus sp.]